MKTGNYNDGSSMKSYNTEKIWHKKVKTIDENISSLLHRLSIGNRVIMIRA